MYAATTTATRAVSSTVVTPSSASPFRVAVIGGGITGATVASKLARPSVNVDVFDQGRRGVGGRTSHRVVTQDTKLNQPELRFDHGCQFFRADTPTIRGMVNEWIEAGFVEEWKGKFVSVPAQDDRKTGRQEDDSSFFGFPSQPPFFVGVGGMHSVTRGLLNNDQSSFITVHVGQRVSGMTRNEPKIIKTNETLGASAPKWTLFGTTGEAAFHDTDEKMAKQASHMVLGAQCYDAVVLTDISSTSFSSWHRASAGVPEEFANRVKSRVKCRVPLFTAMVAFESRLPIDADAINFPDDNTLWFAARNNSKPGFDSAFGGNKDENGLDGNEWDCWTLVSTPEFAIEKIQDTPMQDPETGAFIPQHPDYLTTVPGPELEKAFRRFVQERSSRNGRQTDHNDSLPKTVYLNAQRWGSALPAARHEPSDAVKTLSGVVYEPQRSRLAPTRKETLDQESFVSDGQGPRRG